MKVIRDYYYVNPYYRYQDAGQEPPSVLYSTGIAVTIAIPQSLLNCLATGVSLK